MKLVGGAARGRLRAIARDARHDAVTGAVGSGDLRAARRIRLRRVHAHRALPVRDDAGAIALADVDGPVIAADDVGAFADARHRLIALAARSSRDALAVV